MVASLALVASIAFAQDYATPAYDQQSLHTTGISGLRGERTQVVTGRTTGSGGVYLRGLQVTNINGGACGIGYSANMRLASGSSARRRMDLDDDSHVGPCTSLPSGVINSAPRVTVESAGVEWLVTGVRVCTPSESGSTTNGIAGIRIRTRRWLAAERRWARGRQTEEAASDRCSTWHRWMDCPDGQVAVGFSAYHNGSTYRGLQLVCATPQINDRGATAPTGATRLRSR